MCCRIDIIGVIGRGGNVIAAAAAAVAVTANQLRGYGNFQIIKGAAQLASAVLVQNGRDGAVAMAERLRQSQQQASELLPNLLTQPPP